MLYDVGDIAYTLYKGEKVSATQYAALGADGVALFVPYVTGAGVATRLAAKTTQVTTKVVNYSAKVSAALSKTSALRNAIKLTDKLSQAHHVIPVKLLEKNSTVQKAVEAGFDFNGAVNGLGVKTSRHGRHDNYTNQVESLINQFEDRMKAAGKQITGDDAKKFLEGLTPTLKKQIQEQDTKKVNEIIIKGAKKLTGSSNQNSSNTTSGTGG